MKFDASSQPLPGILGTSRALRATCARAQQLARTRSPVLIVGETGTGKELFARAIHAASPVGSNPMVSINCAALPEPLLESELFGHQRGAFTGAHAARAGLLVTANGGTLFLDEVGELPPSLQAKLLRAIQEREIRPVGGNRAQAVDVRLIAATHRNLEQRVAEGSFREDFYYRLAVLKLEIPPLRKRPEDIPVLAHHLLERHAKRSGQPDCELAPETLAVLQLHAWPGNVRELENEIQRLLAIAEGESRIPPTLLSDALVAAVEPVTGSVREGESLRESVDRFEAWAIRTALHAHDGRRARTARSLGITREGLYNCMPA